MSIRRLNKELRLFDKELYAEKSDTLPTRVFRRGVHWESYQFEGATILYSRPNPYYVLSLTHDWSLNGKPVEWGIEPLLQRLREIDNHNHDVLERIYEENEKRDQLNKRSKSNEIKALATDLRRDFAKTVNDINTSTLEKVESRRNKDAYCK